MLAGQVDAVDESVGAGPLVLPHLVPQQLHLAAVVRELADARQLLQHLLGDEGADVAQGVAALRTGGHVGAAVRADHMAPGALGRRLMQALALGMDQVSVFNRTNAVEQWRRCMAAICFSRHQLQSGMQQLQ